MSRTVNRLNKQAEQRLTDALGEVAQLVGTGSDPNDAIVKVATDLGLPAGHVNLMVQTYNIGRQEAQRRAGTDLFEKSAEFTLADASRVLERMFPANVKTAGALRGETAVDEEYSRRPDWAQKKQHAVKAASAALPPMRTRDGKEIVAAPPQFPTDPAMLLKHAYCQALDLQRAVADARAAAANAHDELTRGIAKLGEYFRTPGCQPFPLVRDNAARLFGKKAELLMGMIGDRNRHLEKQALSRGQLADPVRFDVPPYSLIKACVAQAETYLSKQAAFEDLDKTHSAKVEELLDPFVPASGPAPRGVLGCSEPTGGKKVANFAGGVLGGLSAMRLAAPTPESVGASMSAKMDDPEQDMKIRNMQTSGMLTDLMANDDVIAGFHPDDVLQHYNEISQLAPRASSQEGLVRAILRKRLEGGKNAIDPYDVDLLLNIENKIKQRDDPSYGKTKMGEDAKGVLNAGRSVLA